MFYKLASFFKDLLFPVHCVECGAEGQWWCAACQAKANIKPFSFCPACGKPSPSQRRGQGEVSSIHINCQVASPLTSVTAFFNYAEGSPIARLIRQYKYHFASDIDRVWKQIFLNSPELSNVIYCHFDRPSQGVEKSLPTIIPVPLYGRRERERGFNQANRLAKILAEQTGLPLIPGRLKRIKATAQQAKLSRPDRQTNVQNAFAWQGSESAPSSVILVDDVFTTGATMNECAKVLMAHGTRTVRGLVLARD